jgi:hypothetical protein
MRVLLLIISYGFFGDIFSQNWEESSRVRYLPCRPRRATEDLNRVCVSSYVSLDLKGTRSEVAKDLLATPHFSSPEEQKQTTMWIVHRCLSLDAYHIHHSRRRVELSFVKIKIMMEEEDEEFRRQRCANESYQRQETPLASRLDEREFSASRLWAIVGSIVIILIVTTCLHPIPTTNPTAAIVKIATSNHHAVPLNLANILFVRKKLEQLGSEISGDICFADDNEASDSDFFHASLVWNILAPTPLAVIQVQGELDVQMTLPVHHIPFVVRSGGHHKI